ncbi:MAG: hypothetical protein NWE92_05155 [Candidatus Bathyarchaeota archaeon]|nr:hypothetical protein [Candidatus Bathyarchaeota archaeon]
MSNKAKTLLSLGGILLCLTSLFLPWWTMSASLIASRSGYNYVGYTVGVTANLLWVEGGSRCIPALNESDIKSSYLVYGEQYWFGWSAFSLIAIGVLLSTFSLLVTKVQHGLKKRFFNIGFVFAVIGISVFLLGLEFSLNSARSIGKQDNLFQDLNVLSGNFGNTYFGLFGSGSGFQQEPYVITYELHHMLIQSFFPTHSFNT